MSATSLLDPESKAIRRAFKARRRTELGLLVAASVIITCAYALMIYGNTAKVPNDVAPLLAVMLALGGVAHIANRIFVPSAHPVVLPIAFLLNGLGYVMILRIDLANASNYAPLQAAWTAGGVAAYVLTLAVVRRSRDLDRYRYILLALGVILLLLPLVPHLGRTIGGARLWVHVGQFEFQPVELAKIVLCIFFASYFVEKRELLTIPTARLGNRLVLDPRPLVPILLAWAFAIGVMSLEHDIGFSALLFTLFIGMLWVTTGRTGYLVLGVVLFGVGAFLSGRYLVPDPYPGGGLARSVALRHRPAANSWCSRGTPWGAAASADPDSASASAPTRSRCPTPTSSSPSSARRWACWARPWWWWPSCCWWGPGCASPRRPGRSSPSSPRWVSP